MKEKPKITSVKPGRAPSFLGGIGSLVAVAFGILWTIMASSMTRGSPLGGGVSLFPLFGILFILAGIANAVYSFTQATQKNRYSLLDITDSESEPDPLNERFGSGVQAATTSEIDGALGRREPKEPNRTYCPYCGRKADGDYRFCPYCGKELPE